MSNQKGKIKSKLTAVVLLLTTVSLFGSGEAVFNGRVVSVISDTEAILIVERSSRAYYALSPPPNTAVYVYANFGAPIDGSEYKISGKYIGRKQYQTAAGGVATLLAVQGQAMPILRNY